MRTFAVALSLLAVSAAAGAEAATPSGAGAGFGPVRLGDPEASLVARGYDCKSAPHRDRMCIASASEALGLDDVTLTAYLERDAVESIELDFPQADAEDVARRLALRFGDAVKCDGVDCKGTLGDGETIASQGPHVVLSARDYRTLMQMRGHMALQLRIWCRDPGPKTDEQQRECAAAGL